MMFLLLRSTAVIAKPQRACGNPFLDIRKNCYRVVAKLFLAMTIVLFTCLPSRAAIEFDGMNDYVNLGNTGIGGPLDITGHITISVWAKIDDFTPASGDTRSMFVSKGFDGSKEQYHLGLTNDTNLLCWYTYSGGVIYGVTWAHNLIVGEWYAITGVFDGTEWIIYVNGIEKAAVANSTNPQHTAKPVLLGAADVNNTISRFFAGSLDDVRIYDSALSSAEVETLYKSRKKRISGSLAQGLVAHYEMDENEIGSVVGTIIDASGNSNHGTGNGGASLIYTDGVLRR